MSRSRFCRVCRDFHDVDEPWPEACYGHFGIQADESIQVVRDMEPYRSMIDGSVIDGRKRHRDHLKAHGCIEVGNDTSHIKRKPEAPISPSRKESLHRMLADVGDRDIQRIVQNELRNRR